MRSRFKALLIASTTAIIMVGQAEAGPVYLVRQLDALGDGPGYAADLNNSGQVVGIVGNNRPVLFGGSIGAPNMDIGAPDPRDGFAVGINDNGQVVGITYINASGTQFATLFSTSGGAKINLGTLGGTNSSASKINNSGQVIGYSDTPDGRSHATLYSSTGGANIDLGTLGGTNSYGFAINNSGQAVGYGHTTSEYFHAILFRLGGVGNLDLGTLGGLTSYALGINDLGQVVGYAYLPGDTTYRATLFSTTGGPNVDLGLIGGIDSYAVDINNGGQVVGNIHLGQGLMDPFIWSAGQMVLLDSLISPDSEWDLAQALAINDSGQIAAYGCSRGTAVPNGRDCHALLLSLAAPVVSTIPEPGTLALLALGLAGFGYSRRKQ